MAKPGNRKLANWLDAYQEYTHETESSPMFHKWVGISMVGGSLRKKVSLSLGRIKIFPNLYVILVAEPGVSRKSQAITYGVDILKDVPNVVMSADAITKEALLQDLEATKQVEMRPGAAGQPAGFEHSSLNIISKEFESFLGQKGENTKMVVLLTDLYDCSEGAWRYRTKNSGTNSIQSVFLNILGATTPDSLASCLPSSAIGGGLTSRMIFVWSSQKTKKIPIPTMTEELKTLKQYLLQDLTIISRMDGEYQFSPEAIENWCYWYNHYDETSVKRICTDPAFNGWYSRKPMFLQKLAMIFSACEHSDFVLEWKYFEKAIEYLTEVELAMGQTFTSIGKNNIAGETATVMDIIKRYGTIGEKQLMQIVWRDIDNNKFDLIVSTIIRTGKFKREYTGPNGEKGIYYTYIGGEVR